MTLTMILWSLYDQHLVILNQKVSKILVLINKKLYNSFKYFSSQLSSTCIKYIINALHILQMILEKNVLRYKILSRANQISSKQKLYKIEMLGLISSKIT